MIITSQRTIYSLDLQTDMLLHRNYTPLLNTTLNEKFTVASNAEMPEGVYPKLDYLVIGIGGTEIMDDRNYKFSKHKPIDAALFKHIPYVMRTVDNDLLPDDRRKYRLRTTETYNGTTYMCYYMKVITNTIVKNGLFQVTTTDTGLSTLNYFNTNRSDLLKPVPRIVSDNYLDPTKSTYITKTAKIEFSIYNDEIEDIEAAMIIIYGEISNITEIGICTGREIDINGYPEVANCVINYFVDVDLNTSIYFNTQKDILRAIEIGGMEPMVI